MFQQQAAPGEAPAPEADVPSLDLSRLPLAPPRPRIDGVLIGTLRGFGADGGPLVDHPANPSGEPLPARTTAALCRKQTGREVVLMFEAGDPARPVVLGVVQEPKPAGKPCGGCGGAKEASVDGKQLVFEAEQEIVLRCGEASIVLTRAGKILLRGNYVLSRSTGVNKIKGGSVQIN